MAILPPHTASHIDFMDLWLRHCLKVYILACTNFCVIKILWILMMAIISRMKYFLLIFIFNADLEVS